MALDMKTGKLSVIASLDHVNILTNDVEACRRFYVDGLGFDEGFRPAFKEPGLWLYIGGTPVVHIIETGAPLPKHNGTIDGQVQFGVTDSGAVDHIAFRALNFDKFTARLDDHGIKWQDREIPGMDLHQLFCFDPHGVKVEFNFEGQDRPWKTLQKTHKEVLTARAKNKAKGRKKVKVLA
jgi:catechol 2,3-dioxygenase-like lactoylglutathione lyase family enzyme